MKTTAENNIERRARRRLKKREVHGDSNRGTEYHRLYKTWKNIRQRSGVCYCGSYIRDERLRCYVSKHIEMCPEWVASYLAFKKWALSHGWRVDLTIDRIDNEKGYCPDNCRWATFSEQNRNRRMSQRWYAAIMRTNATLKEKYHTDPEYRARILKGLEKAHAAYKEKYRTDPEFRARILKHLVRGGRRRVLS